MYGYVFGHALTCDVCACGLWLGVALRVVRRDSHVPAAFSMLPGIAALLDCLVDVVASDTCRARTVRVDRRLGEVECERNRKHAHRR